MNARSESQATSGKNRTTIERTSEREVVVTRLINGPVRLVYEAWTKPELFQRWWIPKSAGVNLLSCELDVRTGGGYRLVFAQGDGSMAFHGKYLEVIPQSRMVWTNAEQGDDCTITTVTFQEQGGKTLVVMHDLHPSKEALDAFMASGMDEGTFETFDQLDEFVAALPTAA